MTHSDLLLISVGNSRTRLAPVASDKLEPSVVVDNANTPALAEALAKLTPSLEGAADPTVLLASVNDRVADQVVATLPAGVSLFRFGSDLTVPLQHTLQTPETTGQDRFLAAYGAFARSEQACVVIDAGTAITVDFIDGQGIYHGGAIGPGLSLLASSLHEKVPHLPALNPASEPLPKTPFGPSTRSAIALGCFAAARGMVRHLIDTYAEHYAAYPRIVATGGDAPVLFEHDELVETIVPDLVLIGMLAAYQYHRDHADAE